MTEKETAQAAVRKTIRALEANQPQDFGAAVISVTPHGDVSFKSNMTPEVIAYTLVRLSEEAIKQIGAPILEEAKHGTDEKRPE